MSKNLKFKVSSALKSVIGRDLITNDFVAIFELVKNSIDAGAKKIDIFFQLDKHEEQCIYIVDNGKGMSFNDIEEKWIFLGYSAKREGTEDHKRKIYAGNKGVGRFSCDRLGGKLHLQTLQKGTPGIHNVYVDWGKFEQDSREHFTNIVIGYEAKNTLIMPGDFPQYKSGTILKITELREVEGWDRTKLLRLKSSLGKLINPFGDRTSSCDIKIHCEREWHKDQLELQKIRGGKASKGFVNGAIENNLIGLLSEKTTEFRCCAEGDGYFYTSLTDRGVMIYKAREPLSSNFKVLQDSKFSARIFFLNRSAKATFKRQMGISALNFGSLFLYRNGFRVFPTGEEGDDSWGLNRRKQQGHSRYLGTRDLMGRIDVYGTEDDFRESSSRDKGLIETEASLALHECVLNCIRRFERYVVGISWRDQWDKEYDTAERIFLDANKARVIDLVKSIASSDDAEIIDYNRDLVSLLERKSEDFEPSLRDLRDVAERLNDTELIKKVRTAEQSLKRAKQDELEAMALAEREETARIRADKEAAKVKSEKVAVEKAYEEERMRNFFLSRLTPQDSEHLQHFIHQMILYAGNNIAMIEHEIGKIKKRKGDDWSRTLDVFYRLREGMDKVITVSRYMTLANFRMNSGKIESDLARFVRDHIINVSSFFSQGISVSTNEIDSDFILAFSPIDMGMVVDNLISNSQKANATKVDFFFSLKGDALSITVTDDGDGLAADILSPSDIFEKGFTRTDGSGLGLHFCRSSIATLGGQIVVNSQQPKRGFSLLIGFKSK